MEKGFLGRAVAEVSKAALLCTALCLFAEALFAVFVRAFAPETGVISAVNWCIKCAGVFLCTLFFIRKERSLFKGIAAGVLSVLLTMLLFGFLGGFHLTPLFLVELLAGGLVGGTGAIIGAKIRKE